MLSGSAGSPATCTFLLSPTPPACTHTHWLPFLVALQPLFPKMEFAFLVLLMLWGGMRFPQKGEMQTLFCYQAGNTSCISLECNIFL